MADKTGIGWTDATPIIDRGGRRIRFYRRKRSDGPGIQHRRVMAALGFRWCRHCQLWLASHLVTKTGLCHDHANADYRRRYASDGGRIRRQKVARKRGVDALSAVALEVLEDEFDGRCAYCPRPATTFDHIVPVSAGGGTTPGNIVPACVSCNSSKRDRPLHIWLATREDGDPHPALFDALALAANG